MTFVFDNCINKIKTNYEQVCTCMSVEIMWLYQAMCTQNAFHLNNTKYQQKVICDFFCSFASFGCCCCCCCFSFTN